MITGILNFIVYDLLGTSSILVGFIAMFGLILQKKKWDKVVIGTIKTIVGFIIFSAGSSLATSSLNSFQTLFTKAFNLEGVLPLAEAVTALAQNKFGPIVALIMVTGFIANLIIARLTPFKYIFLTGQHNLYLAALLTVIFKANGVSDGLTIGLGAIILGASAALFPAIAQRGMKKITGENEIAMGHYVTLAYALSSFIGSKVGKPEDSTEKLKLPSWLMIFKDYVVSVALSVAVFYYISAFMAGKAEVEALSGNVSWILFPFLQSLSFAASLFIIITGVRMVLGEIVSAFVGISEKLIPNAKPALDCPVVFQYAPTATVIGFLSAYIGGLLCIPVFIALKTPVIIPVAVPYFFIGATAGVFGNATGGWKGAIAGGFITGILIAVGPALIYPIMSSIGLTGTSFPETDFVSVGLILNAILSIFN
ncbi:PTS ascorbate transporter subunit IIC [Brachyspira pilosicoli]|uniref:Ascorbate-specific PTS system EIIC component n=7 Tax=Brachyspira pilosicoli TaxID=52584 RepID=D8ID55_BRAP9|nr:PTS ascorbate transporter subunit IIC [Brachyspira pilosicoli]ADK31078.1 ascorbate-specific PTS system enzyme IIC [Brachyspira pilosicoli 95/1000]AFR69608.1 PTS system ascorbate-specific transporter subunit IIC [Brachyspira pilosicoli B2904]AGA67105.1 PTS system ascorbate-specific transporter subunit IIC [Brachyspira pilosicoli P43/6/78]WIH80907.1 PTS transporter subunit IIC [Brachyspira pilosicoli]WIH83118.1 PTS transporter subunit IIC [Brachyspira pilosicoli]